MQLAKSEAPRQKHIQFNPELLGRLATEALIAEAKLTPKPGLVDERGSGAHRDLSLNSMLKSAHSLRPFFQRMALIAEGCSPNLSLRSALAECGLSAEQSMLSATAGSNAHRGAIWCLGLLIAGASIKGPFASIKLIAETAAQIARIPLAPQNYDSHGRVIEKQYGIGGARTEAENAFPHVVKMGLPFLLQRRANGVTENACRLDTLLTIMSTLEDTCLIHRAGLGALSFAQDAASEILSLGGVANHRGMAKLFRLDKELLRLNASPGGSADLLAATLFLDSLQLKSECEN